MAAQVMQATCPGCKTILRIPAEWANQPIRCKQCGMTFQTKVAGAAPPPKPAPPPPPRASKTPAPAARPVKKAPPPPPTPRPARKPEAVKAPAPVAKSVPVAAPVASGSPFDFAGGAPDEDAAPVVRKRPRRGNGGLWVGLGLMVALVAVSAGL